MHVYSGRINKAYLHLKETLDREPTIDEVASYLEEQGLKVDRSIIENTLLHKKYSYP